MSTRANIQISDESTTLMLYRHSDGYPEGAGADLTEFVKDYTSGALRDNADQSVGWLIVRGHFEYKGAQPAGLNASGAQLWPATPDCTGPRPNAADRYMGWKVGAYEPTTSMHGDEEYIYVINLVKRTLTCRVPTAKYWGKPCLKNTAVCKKFKTVRF